MRKQYYQAATTTSVGVAAAAGCDGPALAAASEVLVSVAGAEAGGGEGFKWAGVLCFNFMIICRILERFVGFPGFGPWITTMEGFFS